MDLLEYQGKQLFAQHGVPVPEGRVASGVDEAVAAADEGGYPCVVKAQVQIGGRGKAGGIKIAESRDEAHEHAEAILGMDIRGPRGEGPFTVHEVWIERAMLSGSTSIAATFRPAFLTQAIMVSMALWGEIAMTTSMFGEFGSSPPSGLKSLTTVLSANGMLRLISHCM